MHLSLHVLRETLQACRAYREPCQKEADLPSRQRAGDNRSPPFSGAVDGPDHESAAHLARSRADPISREDETLEVMTSPRTYQENHDVGKRKVQACGTYAREYENSGCIRLVET